jgi:hypothetical protein
MPSNIDYDPYLLSEVLKVGGFKYKKDALNTALKEYLQRHQQVEILDLFGSIEYDRKYDYKKKRKR